MITVQDYIRDGFQGFTCSRFRIRDRFGIESLYDYCSSIS